MIDASRNTFCNTVNRVCDIKCESLFKRDDVPKTTDALVLSNDAVALNVATLAKSSKKPPVTLGLDEVKYTAKWTICQAKYLTRKAKGLGGDTTSAFENHLKRVFLTWTFTNGKKWWTVDWKLTKYLTLKFFNGIVAILYPLFVYIAHQLVAVMRYLTDISPVK